jgi:Sec-independent protein secretion pathway component TatC
LKILTVTIISAVGKLFAYNLTVPLALNVLGKKTAA